MFVPPFKGQGPLLNLVGFSGVVAIVAGIRAHKPRARAAWWLFAAGQFLFFSGDVYTYSNPNAPFPSPGDALYLAVYPVLMAGLFVLVKRRNPRRDPAALIDALILTIGIGLLAWVFLIAPNIHLTDISWLGKAVSIAYPLGDVLLLAAAIRLAVDAGKRAPAFYLLAGSIVCLLATDSAYNLALLKGTYNHSQLIYDLGWMMYYVLWGAAALHPSMRVLEEPATDSRARLTSMRLALLGAACLIAPSIRFVQSLGNPDVVVLIVASAVLFLLVVIRMAGLVRQEERIVSRERTLRAAGAELVGAAGSEQINNAAIAGVRRLLGESTCVHLALLRDGTPVVAASSEDAEWGLTESTFDWLREHARDARFSYMELPREVRNELRFEGGTTVLLAPLAIRSEVRGLLVANSFREVSEEVANSFQALGLQVSLAVEGASLAADLHRRQSEARFRSLVAHSSDLITVLDANGIVTYQSPSIERVLGYRADEVEGTQFDWLLSEADRPRLRGLIAGDGSGSTDAHTLECSLAHKDGTSLRFEVQHTDLLHDEHVHGIVLNSRDVSERKEFEDQLQHQAFHDPVTNLANRALFADRVEHALMRSQRGFPDIAVVFIDLDDFKTVNDSLGHAAGDEVLKEVARRLRIAVRPTDTVARFGGDEFAVLLESVNDSAQAADAAARILHALELPYEIDGKQVFPRASIGICLIDRGIKRAGGGRAAAERRRRDVHGEARQQGQLPGLRAGDARAVVERLELRAELQQAIEFDQLELYYQPVVRLAGHEILGVEALLRWQHPTRGTIPPDQFIPLAEETGLIISMGRWVLNEACREGVELHKRFARKQPLAISVNLSVRQLQVGLDRQRRARRARDERPAAGVARARDHRVGDDVRHRLRGPAAERPQGARRPARDGRLRHRLLVAQLPEPLPGRHPQDGPLVRGLGGERRASVRDHRARREPRARRRRRGDRARGAGALIARPRLRDRPGIPLRAPDAQL